MTFQIQHPAFKAPRRAPPLQVFTDEELGRARAMLDDATASAQWTVENRQGEALDAQSFARASEGVAMDGEAWREASSPCGTPADPPLAPLTELRAARGGAAEWVLPRAVTQ